jgi:hypothetical protein
MKILDVSDITDSTQFYLKKGTLQFIQDAYKEALASLIKSLIGTSYNNNGTVYILSGGLTKGTSPTYNISAGSLFYKGEIYDFDVPFTITSPNVPIISLVSNSYQEDADPVTLSDGKTVVNIHNILTATIIAGSSSTPGFIANLSDVVPLPFPIVPLPTPVTVSGPGVTGGPDYQIPGNGILYKGVLSVGNVAGNGGSDCGSDFQVNFSPALTTAAYYVVGTIVSLYTGADASDTNSDATVVWTIRDRDASGFFVHFREYASTNQNINFEYIIFAQ